MATGAFWNVDSPDKPFGPFDVNAIIDFPLDVSSWLADELGTTYASHLVFLPTGSPLEIVSQGIHNAGVITPRIKVAAGATYTLGTKYGFTLRIVGADGQQDDRTLYLQLKQR